MTEITEEVWFTKYWRPAMAWQYLVVCVFDFIIFPIMHTIVQLLLHETTTEWHPITLQFGAFYHFTMAMIIGIAVVGRTIEKVKSAEQTPELNSATSTQTFTSKETQSINKTSETPANKQE